MIRFFWRTIPLVLIIGISAAYIQWRQKAATISSGPLNSRVTMQKESIEFLIIGDFGTGNQNQMDVAAAMEEWCQVAMPDGILLLGDNFYMNGVSSVDDPLWQNIIEKPLSGPCLQSIPIYPILGNHDYKGSPNAQIAYSKKSSRWHLPNRFYAIEFDNILEIIGIDTNVFDFCFNHEACTMDFLRHRIRHKKAKFQIVMGHHPAISSSVKYPPTIQGKIIEQIVCDSDAYLAGHAHHFEHRKSANCQSDFLVVGTGGADLSPTHNDNRAIFKTSQHGFVSMTASEAGLRYRFIDTNGNLVYDSDGTRLNVSEKIGGLK